MEILENVLEYVQILQMPCGLAPCPRPGAWQTMAGRTAKSVKTYEIYVRKLWKS